MGYIILIQIVIEIKIDFLILNIEIKNVHDFYLNVINCWDKEFEINYGSFNKKSGELSAKSILYASEALIEKKIDLFSSKVNQNLNGI